MKNRKGASSDKLAEFLMLTQQGILLGLTEFLNEVHISFAQVFLLNHLPLCGQLTMTEIARKMNHCTAAATGMVDRLEKLGYVQRMRAIEDRRKVLVSITRNGHNLVKRFETRLLELIDEWKQSP